MWKSILAGMLVLAMLAAASPVLSNKGIENDQYSAIATYRGFYRQPKDSIDVLFLGTSHSYCAFSPNELEKETGLKSYNLASSQQSLLTSYYWFEEALRYQKPRAVVLDCFYCFYKVGNEGSLHKAFDWMRCSPVKIKAVYDLCREFGSGSESKSVSKNKSGTAAGSANVFTSETGNANKTDSGAGNTNAAANETASISKSAGTRDYKPYQFLIPALRYHDRWSQLSEDDFAYRRLASKDDEKGYCPRKEVSGREFVPIPDDIIFADLQEQASDPEDREMVDDPAASTSQRSEEREMEDDDMAARLPMNPGAKFASDAPQTIPAFQMEYMERIRKLCRENGIELILVKTPTIEWTPAQHQAVQDFAEQAEVEFVDFNIASAISSMQYDFAEDNADTMHANINGAMKLTSAVGDILLRALGS